MNARVKTNRKPLTVSDLGGYRAERERREHQIAYAPHDES